MRDQHPHMLALSALLALQIGGCGAEDRGGLGADASSADTAADVSTDGEGSSDGPADQPDDAPPPCVDGRPIVFVHGLLASGDTWAPHARRLAQSGWCSSRVVAFDWNTLNRTADHVRALDAAVDAALAGSGAAQIDLVGHSAGGGLGYDYLNDPARAAKVAHYVHVGSIPQGAPAGPEGAPVPTLNVWSSADTVAEGADIPGATNAALQGQDHYQVATSAESFEALFRFVTDGAAPAELAVPPAVRVQIGGRAVTFGENTPEAGAAITIRALDETGTETGEPVSVIADAAGRWGPVSLAAGVAHTLLVAPARTDAVPVRYYREPFTADDRLVYLRTLPGPGSLAGALLSALPLDGPGMVLVVFRSSAAVLAGADSLTVGGTEMARPDTAAADKTAIAFFFYDADGDGASDDTVISTFGSFPFLSGVDWFADGGGGTTDVALNDRVVRVQNTPGREGAVVVVFD